MVINTKGGGGKTLVTLMLASYLGRYRSGSVLAWDNNETEGTLGMRAPSQSHHRTVIDLLGALPQIAADPNAGTCELEHWVREQRGLCFDVLASADDDEAMRVIGEQEFEDLHTQLSRFYRMIVIDTGNNRLSPTGWRLRPTPTCSSSPRRSRTTRPSSRPRTSTRSWRWAGATSCKQRGLRDLPHHRQGQRRRRRCPHA